MEQPLLSDSNGAHHVPLNLPSYKSSNLWLRWSLKVIMLVLFLFYIALVFAFYTPLGATLYNDWVVATDGDIMRVMGFAFLFYGLPILLIAFLAHLYLFLPHHPPQSKKPARYRLRTFPVLVDGVFGVVTAAELIPIILFVVFVIWALSFNTVANFANLSSYGDITEAEKKTFMLQMSAYSFSMIALPCFSFLFLPIARGSVLLRLIDVPFEHAIKYHVWLGNFVMFLISLHGLLYITLWIIRGILLESVLEWKSDRGANFAGVLCYTVGLVIWVTTLPFIRRKYFELFYYTHQLYILFIILMALHMGPVTFCSAGVGIFLFMLDRGLRFGQSRKPVDVVSGTCLPCGTIQLVLSKSESLRYNALDFVFIRIRELSRLQWHPFSVSSSPMDGKYHISVLIKVAGEWTEKLRNRILDFSQESCVEPFHPYSNITAFVEGPHGHESLPYLMYENLVLVAGGSGISPFLAVLSDILHRMKDSEPCLPKNILLVWSVKTSIELYLLSTLDMESICPCFCTKLNLDIQIYVTRETEPLLEEGHSYKEMSLSIFPPCNGNNISGLVSTENKLWYGLYIVIPTIGLIFTLSLLYIFYINPFSITYWWYLGLLLLLSMLASAFILGGLVIGFWHHWEKKRSSEEESEERRKQVGVLQHNTPVVHHDFLREQFVGTVQYGHRPDLKGIFERIAVGSGEVDVGVIVCGPSSLEASVARECRSRNIRRSYGHPIFHFNSHSFRM